MILSKERLIKEQKITGYRQEIIEKVIWLIQILNSIAEDSYLKNRLALKGGTALNLFYFDLPRLSVDVDLNYIGAVDLETMLKERPEVEERIRQLLQRLGLTLSRYVQKHAGGKMSWRYASALGNQGNVDVDLNFLYRIPLLAIKTKSSVTLASQQVNQFQLLDLHELAAGKLTALIDRAAGRDFFDAYHLFKNTQLDSRFLRLCFVIYAAMSSKKDYLTINIEDIDVDPSDLQNKLMPMLNGRPYADFPSTNDWIDHLLNEVKSGFHQLLPLNNQECLFIKNIREAGNICPELITSDLELATKIKSHPSLLWASNKSKNQA